MQRRTLVGAVATSVALSGCVGSRGDNDDDGASADGSDDGSGESGPIAALERNWSAYKSGNVEEYVSTYHSESPRRENEPWEDEEYWPVENSSFTVEERTIDDRSDTTAIVHEKIRGGVGDDTSTWWSVVELRTDDGDWRVWDYEEMESEP